MTESEDWLGCRVSLDCGGLGYFQGVISRMSYSDQTVTLEKPFQNGLACKFPEITINSTDIADLKILKSKEELEAEATVKGSSASVIKVQVKKKSKPQTQQSEADHSKDSRARHNKVQSFLSGGQSRASPRFSGHVRGSPRYERQQQAGTPTRYRERQREEEYFRAAGRGGSALNEEEKIMIEKDFDFEANLAMFDKEREMQEIEAELTNKPDIVRLVHSNVRQPEPKYRNDENILGSVVPEYRQIVTGEEEVGDRHFVTDSGLVVPSISLQLRERLQSSVQSHGIAMDRLAEIIGRAATELAIHLLGGQHRLNPSNMHQVPTAVFLCGTSQVATFGLASARHLASHGVKTQVLLPEAARYPAALETELRLYRLTGGKVVTKARDLPSGAVDMIVMAMEDLEMWSQERCQPWHRAAISWAESNRAPVLAIDPPPHPPPLDIKMSLAWGLPLSYSPQSGKLYLVNLGIPKNIYKEVGIKFSSPFGAKFVIPLHHT